MGGLTSLKKADAVIRPLVKLRLHLIPATATRILYSRWRDGGLAIPSLYRLGARGRARRIYQLLHSDDPAVSGMAEHTIRREVFGKLWLAGGGDREQLTKVFRDLTKRGDAEHDVWCLKVPQGLGASLFKADKVSNDWLRVERRGQWKESHFIRAFQLRTNTLPTLELRSRGTGGPIPSCRACNSRPETASHILGGCEATKLNHMERHNRLCALLAGLGGKFGWQVKHEKHVFTRDGRLGVPDLVMVRGRCLLVVDVTVVNDGSRAWMDNGRNGKVAKYKPFLGMLSLEYPLVRNSSVHGFVLGTRGKWLESNFGLLGELGVGKAEGRRFTRLCSRITTLKSVDVFQAFNEEVRGKELGIVTYAG